MLGGMEIGLFGALILALNIYSIYAVLMEDSSGLRKVLWILGIIVFPVVGTLLYLLFFRKRPAVTKSGIEILPPR